MTTIAIVDYGMGNLRSVAQALRVAAPDATVQVVQHPDGIRNADRVVLPGQGAMPDCMSSLHNSGLFDALMDAIRNKPLLGVCVGEQMLFNWSAEARAGTERTAGLGVLPGAVIRFDLEHRLQHDGSRFKVPHMGWNQVAISREHPLWTGIADHSWFYFVHSYHVICDDAQDSVGVSDYGGLFTCAVARDNIFATQFHPEKSAHDGLQLYRNFVNWKP